MLVVELHDLGVTLHDVVVHFDQQFVDFDHQLVDVRDLLDMLSKTNVYTYMYIYTNMAASHLLL